MIGKVDPKKGEQVGLFLAIVGQIRYNESMKKMIFVIKTNKHWIDGMSLQFNFYSSLLLFLLLKYIRFGFFDNEFSWSFHSLKCHSFGYFKKVNVKNKLYLSVKQ